MYRSLVFLITVAILMSKQAHAAGEWEAIQAAKNSSATLGKNVSDAQALVKANFDKEYAKGVAAYAKDEGVSEETVRSYVAQQNGGSSATGTQVYTPSSLSNATGSNTATLNSGTSAISASAVAGGNLGNQREALNTTIPTTGKAADGKSADDILGETGARCANEFGRNSSRHMVAAYEVMGAAISSIKAEGATTTPAKLCARVITMAGLPNLEYLMCAAEGRPCPTGQQGQQQGYQDPALISAIAQSQAAQAARAAQEESIKLRAESLQRYEAQLQKKKDEEEHNNALMLMLMYAVGGNSGEGGPDMSALMQFIKSAD